VNDYIHNSFAERAVTWLHSTEFVLYVITGVVLLFYHLPAYKRFRTRALMLLVIACVLDIFITVFDHTIGQHGTADPNDWWSYSLCREVAWIVAVILGTVGSLMFLRDYTRIAAAVGSDAPSPSSPTIQATSPKSQ
jgi:hypothetical protein